MLLYEILAIGTGAVLVAAAIGHLAARVMMGRDGPAAVRASGRSPAPAGRLSSPEETGARVAEAQRRLVAPAVQQDDWIWRYLKRQYEDALAAPLSPRLATLITHLETQQLNA